MIPDPVRLALCWSVSPSKKDVWPASSKRWSRSFRMSLTGWPIPKSDRSVSVRCCKRRRSWFQFRLGTWGTVDCVAGWTRYGHCDDCRPVFRPTWWWFMEAWEGDNQSGGWVYRIIAISVSLVLEVSHSVRACLPQTQRYLPGQGSAKTVVENWDSRSLMNHLKICCLHLCRPDYIDASWDRCNTAKALDWRISECTMKKSVFAQFRQFMLRTVQHKHAMCMIPCNQCGYFPDKCARSYCTYNPQ